MAGGSSIPERNFSQSQVKIGGYLPTSLIEWPGKLSAIIWTIGCNFRCPFCHNKDLVKISKLKNQFPDKYQVLNSKLQVFKQKEILTDLKKRKDWIDGLVISGGEPTIQSNLVDFCVRVKKIGLEIMLETNGSQPEMIKKLIKNNLVDFWAMDFKTVWENYFQVTGFKKIAEIKKSINLILAFGKPLELRTTIVPGIHDEKILLAMARELRESFKSRLTNNDLRFAKPKWKWQNFQPKNTLDPAFEKIKPYSEGQIKKLKNLVFDIFPVVE